jgi:hypothetical protein
MLQYQKNFIGIWYKNTTVYYFTNIHLSYNYNKIGSYVPIMPGFYMWGALVSFDNTIPDMTSSETNRGQRWNIFYYYDYATGNHPQTNLTISDLDVTFCSRGIGGQNAVTINYSFN